MVLCLLVLATLLGQAQASTIEGIRLWRAPDNTRVVFDMSAFADHRVSEYKNPNRVAVDIPQAKLSSGAKKLLTELDIDNTPITGIRTGLQKNGDLRVVFDLKVAVGPASFFLKAIDDKPDRLVIDLRDVDKPKIKTVENVTGSDSRRDIIIAIDPGHGGEDPGAVGSGGLYEKDIVLLVSKNLRNVINKQKGYKAFLTRETDYFIPVRERPKIAREKKPDFFVSVHADGWHKSSARGASVFILSEKASSKMAERFASRENKSDLIGGVDDIDLGDKPEDVRKILVDLSNSRNMEVSADIGSRILKQLGGFAHLHSKQVESANFGVLRSVDVPSVLVETGFITNPGEAKKLNTLEYRTKLAKAIFRGINNYFVQIPPEGSYLSWKKNNTEQLVRHIIAKGDTLSGIARRYKVSVAQIKAHNSLSSSTIRIGQTLEIPAI
jgi:N-acetylmuramoyl-L-alanine amidase